MKQATRNILAALAASGCLAFPAGAERLTLAFLPPDLPASDICNAEPERFDDEETQITDAEEPGEQVLDEDDRIQFLSRDIRNLQRTDADGAFDFIMALITFRARIEPEYAGFDETFDRIDTYLAANRLEALAESGLIQDLAERVDEMNWSQTVRLSRFYLNGIGVAKDRDLAVEMILEQAFLGSADALLEVLRMQLRGDDVSYWGLKPEDTAKLAFGGMVGKLNRGLCDRAERIAREYTDGDILTPNPELAYAWRKFAADMGGADAAWRVVEHHLSATGAEKDDSVLRHYLQKAVANGAVILPENVDAITSTGAETEAEIRRILGMNHSRAGNSDRLSAVPYFALDVRITTTSIAEDGVYFQYLREISDLPGVPGPVLTELAKETLLRKGRWKGQIEAEELLRKAVQAGDPEAMMLLAEILLRDRSNPARIAEVEWLLVQAVEQHGETQAMKALDNLYRCQLPGAPRLGEAGFWADAYRAADNEPVTVSATDVTRLDPRQEPEAVARIQSLALQGHSNSAADWLQYLQSDRTTPEFALRYWADRVSRSDMALEKFMGQEFELALTAQERRNAIELFRRVYLDIGSSISLDLALTLVEDAGRDPIVADEIRELLTNSARRGQGAAIRLLQRLSGRDGAEVYREFASDIEARGDFVAHIFAAPHVPDETFHRYMERAVSVMNCATKDISELTEAFAARNMETEVMHWVRIGLSLEGGSSLTKLGLSDQQMAAFDRGVSIAQDVLGRPGPARDEFDFHRRRYLAAADAKGPDFDADAAGEHLAAIFGTADRDRYIWALSQYRQAEPEVRRAIDGRVDVRSALRSAAEAGDPVAQYQLGMLLRTIAEGQTDLVQSTRWLTKAAEGGHGDAMTELAFAIGFGIGRQADPKLALIWLDRADGLYPGIGRELRDIFAAMVSE